MASSNDFSPGPHEEASDADLAKISEAWAHIVKGEKTAQALEANLTSLEKKIDDLLASFEESERQQAEASKTDPKEPKPSNGEGASNNTKQS